MNKRIQQIGKNAQGKTIFKFLKEAIFGQEVNAYYYHPNGKCTGIYKKDLDQALTICRDGECAHCGGKLSEHTLS